MLDLNVFAQDVHAVSVEHGWWEGERDDAKCVALMCCEVAEALEEYRDGRPMVWHLCMESGTVCDMESCENWEDGKCATDDMTSKPEGIAVELIDCCLRILDFAGERRWEMWPEYRTFEQFCEYECDALEGWNLMRVAAWLFTEISACLDVESNQVYRVDRLMEIVGSIARWIEAQGVDFEKVLRLKHECNKTRSYRHGGKRC